VDRQFVTTRIPTLLNARPPFFKGGPVRDTIALDKSCDKLALLSAALRSIPVWNFSSADYMGGTADTDSMGLLEENEKDPRDTGPRTRGVPKEIYCRDKGVRRKTRVKAAPVTRVAGNAGSDASTISWKASLNRRRSSSLRSKFIRNSVLIRAFET